LRTLRAPARMSRRIKAEHEPAPCLDGPGNARDTRRVSGRRIAAATEAG
jgi:hypothetical protein